MATRATSTVAMTGTPVNGRVVAGWPVTGVAGRGAGWAAAGVGVATGDAVGAGAVGLGAVEAAGVTVTVTVTPALAGTRPPLV